MLAPELREHRLRCASAPWWEEWMAPAWPPPALQEQGKGSTALPHSSFGVSTLGSDVFVV